MYQNNGSSPNSIHLSSESAPVLTVLYLETFSILVIIFWIYAHLSVKLQNWI